jgi:cholesterol transport system auxiliary component
MKKLLLSIGAVLLAGCHFLVSHGTAKASFDFGMPPTSEPPAALKESAVNIIVPNIVAPGWLDNSAMYYRLTYADAGSPVPYANSQWVMSPVALLTQRVRWRLGASNEGRRDSGLSNRERYILRGELIEFEQIFDRPNQSHGVLRLRATLEEPRTGNSAQRTFTIEKAAPTPDAAGGVKALSQCADELSESVTQWVVAELGGGGS